MSKKIICKNTKNFMEVVEYDEFKRMTNPNVKGNCMKRTAERLNYLVRKYGVNNLAIMPICFIKNRNNKDKYIQHVVIYNKKQDKVIDCANGIISLIKFDDYLDRVLPNTKKHYYAHIYLNEKPIKVSEYKNKTINKVYLFNDELINKLCNEFVETLICSIISQNWKNMKDKLLNE